VSGEKKEQLKNALTLTVMKGAATNPDFKWLPEYGGVYRDRQGVVDLGIYAQTLSLILAEHELLSCMQGELSQFSDPIKAALNLPEQLGILFGYAGESAAVNNPRTQRKYMTNAVTFFK
jgi:hypothetical protein